jgi:hypothetical protein
VIRRLLAATLLVAVTTACTSAQEEFCRRLEDNADFETLRTGINRDDEALISEALADLQQLADVAPTEIAGDVDALVDAVTGAVRAVTDVDGPSGETTPVDVDELNSRLDGIQSSAQTVVDFADRECELTIGL